MELFATIRRDARIEGLSIRALAKRHNVHRRTIRQALDSAEPPARKPPARSSPKLDPYKPAIDTTLRSDLDAPRKQRHTATRILNRLIEDFLFEGRVRKEMVSATALALVEGARGVKANSVTVQPGRAGDTRTVKDGGIKP